MQSNNIFTDSMEKIRTLRQNSKKTAGHQVLNALERENNEMAKMWLIFSFGLIVTSAITAYLAYKYYRFTFDNSFPDGSFLLSITLTVAVEVFKVWLAYSILSAIIFGWMFKGWSKFFGYSFGAIVAFGAYYWSYNTSTEGVQIYAKETSTTLSAQKPLSELIKEGTADIDAQIASIQTSNDDARAMTTKKGKVNWYGQQSLSANAGAMGELTKSRTELVKAITEQYQKGETKIEAKSNVLSVWVARFGGYSEWAVLFFLLAMIFFDKDSNDEVMGTEAAQKVANKVKEQSAKLTAEELEEELKKAATMNGTYKSAPLGKL